MGLFKKSDGEGAAPVAALKGGRGLFAYFLPAVLVGVMLLLLLTVLAQQAINTASDTMANDSARGVSAAVAARLEGEIGARRDLLALALSDGRAASALADGDDASLRLLEADLQKRIPGMLQVRLLPPDISTPDPKGAAPLGYAGLDMLRAVNASGQPSAAEVHQIKSGTPYLALAVPVQHEGRRVGLLFAAWDMRFIARFIEQAPAFPGRLQLVQGGTAGYVLAKGPGDLDGLLNDGSVDVPGSIWRLDYGISAAAGGMDGMLLLLAAAGAGGLALLLVAVVQWRSLAGSLRADMGAVVNLGEAIMQRSAAPAPAPRLAATRDAMALLGQYARDTRGDRQPAAVGAPPRRAVGAPVPAPEAVTQSARGVVVEEIDHDPAEPLGGGEPHIKIDVPATLFRAYDIRGVVDEALTPAFAQALGHALGSLVQEQGGRRVAVAGDARLSSPTLVSALSKGLIASGCDVLDIGQGPTPLLYFALQTQPVQAGVMVTGSHNPAAYNGFKIVMGERVLDGEALQALRQRMLEGPLQHGKGAIEQMRLDDSYIEAVNQEVQLTRPLKVVVDAGNGAAGELAVATFEALGCEVTALFCEPDGSFPNHHPDPSQPANLASLALEVQAQEADLGVAFDGDGDRLGLVDETGEIVWADSILMLLAADVLGRHPGVDILFDVKSSRHLASFILSHGGRPIMWKSGHSRMRAKMLETGALLGGEFSGHLFIKERWFGFDDAIYAAARVLEILALESRTASALFAELPSSPATPEYQLMLEEGQSGEIMRALDAHKVFDDARLVELDGLRVEFANGWGLIRPSNTVPSLTFRFEADDEGALEQIKARFRDLLRRVAPEMQAPF